MLHMRRTRPLPSLYAEDAAEALLAVPLRETAYQAMSREARRLIVGLLTSLVLLGVGMPLAFRAVALLVGWLGFAP